MDIKAFFESISGFVIVLLVFGSVFLIVVDVCQDSIIRIIREIKRKDYGNKK